MNYTGHAGQIGFIVGTGRCGTTLMAQILNAHSRICVPNELQIIVSIDNGERLYEKFVGGHLQHFVARDFIQLIESCCPSYFEKYFDYYKHFHELQYPQDDLAKVLTDLFDDICYGYNKDVFIEQTPWYGQKLDVLKSLFPEMKVIHLVRDGRDVAASFAKTPWASHDIAENLSRWAKEIIRIHHFGEANAKSYVEVRYEDLVSNPTKEVSKVLGMFDLTIEQEMFDRRKLIDYFSLFKGDGLSYQSDEYKRWRAGKDGHVVFTDAVYKWMRDRRFDALPLSDQIKGTLRLFDYEI